MRGGAGSQTFDPHTQIPLPLAIIPYKQRLVWVGVWVGVGGHLGLNSQVPEFHCRPEATHTKYCYSRGQAIVETVRGHMRGPRRGRRLPVTRVPA